MSSSLGISVIVPSNHGHNELLMLVRAVCGQTNKPDEIVIVDSSVNDGVCTVAIGALCAASSIKLLYVHRACALPGHARNIGLAMANFGLIAFMDVKTIPRPYWLEASLGLLDTRGVAGVWGATFFSAQTKFELLVRDGFYGMLPIRTLPGSVFRREVFHETGQFINWIRAGEDTEWMLRLEVLKIPIVRSTSPLVDYLGLIGLDMIQLLKKWKRNYSAAKDLPHFFPQKLLMWWVLYPFSVLIAFNWNYLLADWRMESPMYIGHVTKIMAILPALIYLIVRGLVLPIQRGVGLWRLLPVRIFAIILVCFMADFVKVLVFSLPKPKSDASIKDDDIL
jgi:glycosyltransferase involved in cell wall biosynthesis